MGQPKKIAFELIESEPETEPYRIMRKVRRDFHPDIDDARIALAWRKGYKPDPEGHIVLGQCIRASDLQREFVDLDFIILLNKEIWEDLQFTVEMKTALVDHELMHATRAYDSEGEPKIDVRGRPVWRVRAHDVQEFFDIVSRHGTYKRDLQIFAESLLKKKNPVFPELEPDEDVPSPSKVITVQDGEIETPFDEPDEELETDNDESPSASSPSDESLLEDAYDTFLNCGKVSAVELLSDLSVNYVKAESIIDAMEERGMVSKPDESGHRTLVTKRKSGPSELSSFHEDEIAKEKQGRGRTKNIVPEIPEPVNEIPF